MAQICNQSDKIFYLERGTGMISILISGSMPFLNNSNKYIYCTYNTIRKSV